MRVRICLLAILGLALAVPTIAFAQDSTSGAVRGTVRDKDTGEAAIGATVVATSPVLQGSQANITDENGNYEIVNLPPGMYIVTVFYMDAEFARNNVLVQLGKTARVNIKVSTDVAAGETIAVQGHAPIIDQASTKTGSTITQEYTQNIPTGRTFSDVLGAASGSQGDQYGTSFGGSTSVENTYIVDGLNTTDPGLGTLASSLPNEFVKETEVITGGYKAEYGRATGGIVNVITKTGSNEFHGSVFGYWSPGAVRATEKPTPSAASSIDLQDKLANDFDFGAEVGGPIIKDKLWFHLGINPSFRVNNRMRLIKSQLDENDDGVPDEDENGFLKFSNVLDRQTFKDKTQRYYYTAKITGAVSQDHQGSLSLTGSPMRRERIRDTITGVPESNQRKYEQNVMDASVKWSSKFFDSNTQFDLVAGAHRDKFNESPLLAGGDSQLVRYDKIRDLKDFQAFERNMPSQCLDGVEGDPFKKIPNCPVQGYRVGGVGLLEDTNATRLAARLDFTQRFGLVGRHTFKTGADIEEQGYDRSVGYTGGQQLAQRQSGGWQMRKYFTLDGEGMPCDFNGDGNIDANCAERNVLKAGTSTRNLSAYVQDDWAILPHVVLNAGVRWEQQQVFVADEIAGEVSGITGEKIPNEAFTLGQMVAPRVGVIYDPTQEGRSRIFGSWGRFYESIPMDINVRAYGGEIGATQNLPADACSPDPGVPLAEGCPRTPTDVKTNYLGSGEVESIPHLKAQYMDQAIVGAEYELFADFKLGLSYTRRDLGRVIEDMSNDGGTTYLIANPGEVDTGGIRDLRAEANDIRNGMTNPDLQARYNCNFGDSPEQMEQSRACMGRRAENRDYVAGQFERIGEFDAPNRTYNALTITADKRFANNFFLAASYTYSKTRGNYPGLFSAETGQLDPNITSMYDLPELMANRYGDLSQDTPHLLKVDAFYKLVAGKLGEFTFGGRARASSGMPHSALGAHSVYGESESYILPRGTVVQLDDGRRVGRSPVTTRFDIKLGWGRPIGKDMFVEAFVDLFNVFNFQTETETDEDYTKEDVNPIVGGDSEDLKHLKVVDLDGAATNVAPTKNPNFGNLSARQDPFSGQFGLRLRF